MDLAEKKENVKFFPLIFIGALICSPTRIFHSGLINESVEMLFPFFSFSFLFLFAILAMLPIKGKSTSYYDKTVFSLVFAIFFTQLIYSFLGFKHDDIFQFNSAFIIFLISCYLIVKKLKTNDILMVIKYSFLLLCILSPISLFAGSYGDLMGRSGSLGLSPNEVALVGGTLFLYGLFSEKNLPIYVTIGFLAMLLSASRRMFFLCLFIFLIKTLFQRPALFIGFVIAIFSLFYLYFQLNEDSVENIRQYVPLFDRLIFASDTNTSTLSFFIDESRLTWWTDSLNLVLQNPFEFRSHSEVQNLILSNQSVHVHNLFIQFCLQYGLIFGIFLTILMFYPFFRILLFLNKDRNENSVFLGCFTILFIVYAFFDYPFFNLKMLFIFCLFFTMSLKLTTINYEKSRV